MEQIADEPLPVYLTRPDALVLRMKMTKFDNGGEGLKAEFGYRDENGNYRSENAPMFSHQKPFVPPAK